MRNRVTQLQLIKSDIMKLVFIINPGDRGKLSVRKGLLHPFNDIVQKKPG